MNSPYAQPVLGGGQFGLHHAHHARPRFHGPAADSALGEALLDVIGVVSAVVPAWRAGRIDILDAIKAE